VRPVSAVTLPALGPVGRLGLWAATHRKLVALIWLVVAGALGFFAPQAEKALSGAGWEATGSESVATRDVVQSEFQGLGGGAMMVVLTSQTLTVDDPAYQQAIADVSGILEGDAAVSTVVPPQPGMSISQDGRTAVVDLSALPDPDTDGDEEALLALYQVVYTVTAGGGIDAVRVRVDGRPYGLSALTGDPDALEPPLTRADLSFVVGAEAQRGSSGCAVAKDDAAPFAGEPALELLRPQDGAVVEETLQVRGRLRSEGGPIVIRLVQDGLEVANRIIDQPCRGAFAASIPVPRTLTGPVELVVSTPATETAPALEARRVVEIAGA